MIEGPFERDGQRVWSASTRDVQVLFAGKLLGHAQSQLQSEAPGEAPDEAPDEVKQPTRHDVLQRIAPGAPPVAWAKQIHSARVLPAVPNAPSMGSEYEGCCGEGDALVVPRSVGLALAIATADCVPVLFAGPSALGAAHAGWRGLASGVIEATIEELARLGDSAASLTAWIGPAIGPCCYEVDDDVAAEIARAGGPDAVRKGPRGKPHLDLHHAAEVQLRAAGIKRISTTRPCTRCDGENLWSYRRDGARAGRNLAFVWGV